MGGKIYSYLSTEDASNTSINEFNIFDSDSYPLGQNYNRVSSSFGMSYNAPAGTFVIEHTGSYFVAVTPFLSLTSTGSTLNSEVVSKIKLNGTASVTTNFSLRNNFPTTGSGRTERTVHTILKNLSVGDEISVTVDDLDNLSPPLGELKSRPGSSIFIYRIEADGGFGNYQINSDTDPATGTAYNPFDGTRSPGSGASIAKTLDDNSFIVQNSSNSGSFKIGTGSLAISFTNIYSEVPGSGGPQIAHRYFKNGTAVGVDRNIKLSNSNDPMEGSIIVMEDYSANDIVGVEVQPSTGNIKSVSGSATSLFTVTSGTHYSYVAAQTNANDGAVDTYLNTFASASYSDNGYSVISGSDGIVYDATQGRFTFVRDGDYAIFLSYLFLISADSNVEVRIRKDGSELFVFEQSAEATEDPVERSIIAVVTGAVSGTYFDVAHRGITDGAIRLRQGTTIAAFEITGTFVIPLNYIPQSTPGNVFGKDYTINTYAQDVLSAQYTRALGAPQVPFFLGTPGPASLRGRENAPITSTGKKKN